VRKLITETYRIKDEMQKVEIVLHKVLGGGSELDYVMQTFWILSPKYLYDLEKDRAIATVKIKVEVLLC
jgi:hypothetical protein